MKTLRLILILVLVVMNFSLDVSHALQVTGKDSSGRDTSTFVYLDTGEFLRVKVGETLVINRNVSAIVSNRWDGGWSKFPVKSKIKIQISLRKTKGLSEQNVMLCMLSVCATGRKERGESSLAFLTREVPILFSGRFPDDHVNDVKYWNVNREDLHSCLPDGTAKLLVMDVEFGDECGLRCDHCARRDDRVDIVTDPLTDDETLDYIWEAHQYLGLQFVKILGRGEPAQHVRFLENLRAITDMGVGVTVFTKGHVLGCDELASKYNSHLGINSSWELIKAIKELENVSILLGFNSFNRSMQERFVGVDRYPPTALLKDFVKFRDRALIDLVRAGFNDYVSGEATKLAMIAAPCKPENLHEIFELYKWGQRRNIYTLTCPTNICGKGADEFEREKEFKDYILKLEDVWAQIYVWAIRTNLLSLDVFNEDGVGLYPGCPGCHQTAAGFYLHLSGQGNLCPGRKEVFFEDIRKCGLRKGWMGSANYQRAKYGTKYNYHCVARDGYSLSPDFYRNIERKVRQALEA